MSLGFHSNTVAKTTRGCLHTRWEVTRSDAGTPGEMVP